MLHADMIEEYSEKSNLSKADTVAEILRAYPKLIAYNQRVLKQENRSFGRMFLMPYEKNKSVYQDDELFAREQRNILEVNEMDQLILFGK